MWYVILLAAMVLAYWVARELVINDVTRAISESSSHSRAIFLSFEIGRAHGQNEATGPHVAGGVI
jgi:hypothetical protein